MRRALTQRMMVMRRFYTTLGSWIVGALLAMWVVMMSAPSAQAQDQEPGLDGSIAGEPAPVAGDPAPQGESRDDVRPRRPQEITDAEVNRRMRDYLASGQSKITVYQIVQEMIDDFIADSKDLNIAVVSPMAVRQVGLTPNLAKTFGMWVESELINAVSKHSDIRIKRCVSCQALRTRLDGQDWVVTLGQVRQEELRDEAQRLGVVAFMDAYVAYVPGANIVSMNVQIYRASDGKILWTETYQSDATTAAVLRSGDRVLTRDEARAELVRKVEQRPYYGYQIIAGAGYIPYDSPLGGINGAMIGGRIYELFGEDKRWLYGFHGESFINIGQNPLLGAFLGATMQYQLNEPNLNDPIYRAGGIVQGFIAGSEGNSFAFEAVAEAIFQFRFGASVSLFYFRPTRFAGADLGGPGFKARAVLNW